MLRHSVFLLATVGMLTVECLAAPARPDRSGPLPVAREFRGVWVATVQNIDWPSRAGLPADKQQQELVAIFDKCVELNLNAVIFQIRTQADAFYPSELEPWSEWLSGTMGEPPKPYYDPLEFAVEEAHRRGLQLHVWFNPYRVRMPGMKKAAAANHASVAQPDIVRTYGRYQWFDPGEPGAEKAFIGVLTDVVKRYDIDGVHIDDYFYPYQERGPDNKIIPFPDDESYKRARTSLERDDWRRQNVDRLVRRMYEEVKKVKPWVLVGISPFGIWRPGNPPGVVGLDQYATLYADARKWHHEGWLDYMTPQLYWKVESTGQPYGKLLAWWAEQNLKERHLWPGNFTSKIGRQEGNAAVWNAEDILRQIEVTRATPGATGNVHFSMKALMRNSDGIADKLKDGPYAEPALVPESSWLGRETPGRPEVNARPVEGGVAVEMKMRRGKEPWQWLVRVLTTNGWKTAIMPGGVSQHLVALPNGEAAQAVMVSGISRLGREGQSARVKIGARN